MPKKPTHGNWNILPKKARKAPVVSAEVICLGRRGLRYTFRSTSPSEPKPDILKLDAVWQKPRADFKADPDADLIAGIIGRDARIIREAGIESIYIGRGKSLRFVRTATVVA